VAPSAFLASASGSSALISTILPNYNISTNLSDDLSKSFATWINLGGVTRPIAESVQHEWDIQITKHTQTQLLANERDERSRARLLACFAPHAGDWLSAPPLTSVGLRMSDQVIRIAAGLRLGTSLCAPHFCSCGETEYSSGIHGLSCQRSMGRHSRHSMVNDIIHRALIKARINSLREPSGIITGSNLRPDGVSLVPWNQGKCVVWDATIPDTLAPSHISSTSTLADAAAEQAATLKMTKYSNIPNSYLFIPVAIETLGSYCSDGLHFIQELGRRICRVTGDKRETTYLFQRLSVAIQRGNAASVIGTMSHISNCDG